MDNTPNLDLPFIMPAQAQKHVTHNEALLKLDAIVQLSVKDRDLDNPPATPANGERYVVGANALSDWAGQDGAIAAYQDGAWSFYTPSNGWLAWVEDEGVLIAWNGSSWVVTSSGSGGGNGENSFTSTTMLGINAAADDTNRLSLRAPATLLNHEGSGHQLKINKASEDDTGSLLYQTNFSGRAEMGLAGNDDFSIKVSGDGDNWQESLTIDNASAAVSFPKGLTSPEPIQMPKSIGALWERGADSSLNGVNWRHIVNQNPFGDGSGVEGENYANEVTAVGWNLSDVVGVPSITGRAALFDTFEYKYNLGGKYVVERHMEMIDETSERHRILSWAAPHDGTTGSALSFAIDDIVWGNFQNHTKIQWQLNQNRAYLGSTTQSFTLNFNHLGSPWGYQYSEDEARFLQLPYFDNANRLVLTGRQQANPGSVPEGENGISYNWNAGELNNGCTLFAVEAATQTDKTVYGLKFDINANWTFHSLIRNNHDSGSTELRIEGGGDAYTLYADASNTWLIGRRANGDFAIGIDPYDSDSDVLTIDVERGALEPKNPIKLPNYAVADLPNATTYGAGSMIFVTDDASGAVTAFSDGSDWRRTTDRQIVS